MKTAPVLEPPKKQTHTPVTNEPESVIDTSKMSKGQREALELTEAARESTSKSFAGDIFMGKFSLNNIYPFPEQTEQDIDAGASFLSKLENLLRSRVDPDAIDEEGDVYVSDWSRSVVHAYQSDGGYITTFVGDAQNLTKWAQQFVDSSPDTQKARRHAKDLESEWRLYYPVAIAVDDKRRIIIVDEQRHRLQLYIKELDYVEPQFNL